MTLHRFAFLFLSSVFLASAMSGAETFTFLQAWDQVQRLNPDLEAAREGAEAAGSAIQQASVRPNPNLSVEAENFGGTSPDSGWTPAETTLSLCQPIETGGKRLARRREALSAHALAKVDFDARRLELWATLVTTFANALAARENQELAAENARLAHERQRVVSLRVKTGKIAPLESSRAALESGLADMEYESRQRETLSAQHRLVALCGQGTSTAAQPSGTLEATRARLPPFHLKGSSPGYARAQQERLARKASLDREHALAYPDIEFSAGLRRFEADDHYAWVGAISLPIPLFNRNRGGIQKARHDLARAEAGERSTKLNEQIEYETLVTSAENEWQEIVHLRDQAIPAARAAMETARTGYEQGKFTYLDWVDAERALIALRSRRINALKDYHATLAKIGQLTGAMDTLQLFTP